MNKAQTLEAATKAVADRGLNYGKPEDNFQRIANLWTAHLINIGMARFEDARLLTAADVAQMMVLMKVARLEDQPDHDDSWIDIAGYAACGADLFNKVVDAG